VKLNTNWLHNAFIDELMLWYVSALTVGLLQGDLKYFLACAAYVST
jgi:hypothetical protein